MSEIESPFKVLICVPFIRSFLVLVQAYQAIKIILKTFPNIEDISNLIFYYNGSQLIPDLTFGEAGIQENTTIVVGIKTDDLSINWYLISLSKVSGDKDYTEKVLNIFKNRNGVQSRHSISNNFSEKKFWFIQNLKSVFNKINFSKQKAQISMIETPNEMFSEPLPVLA